MSKRAFPPHVTGGRGSVWATGAGFLLPPSLPALALALSAPALSPFATTAAASSLDALRLLVPAWRVAPKGALLASVADEAQAAAHVVRHALDRMHRLRAAYGEWADFDAGAYFDLSAHQTALLVEGAERLTAVHITLHADLLLPRVRQALQTWCQTATLLDPQPPCADEERLNAMAQMAADWKAAVAVVVATRRLLAGEIGYLSANAANEERRRWLEGQHTGSDSPERAEIRLPGWFPGLLAGAVPTLTLAADFPLPAWRQPGRRRRLQRARAARRARAEQERKTHNHRTDRHPPL